MPAQTDPSTRHVRKVVFTTYVHAEDVDEVKRDLHGYWLANEYPMFTVKCEDFEANDLTPEQLERAVVVLHVHDDRDT